MFFLYLLHILIISFQIFFFFFFLSASESFSHYTLMLDSLNTTSYDQNVNIVAKKNKGSKIHLQCQKSVKLDIYIYMIVDKQHCRQKKKAAQNFIVQINVARTTKKRSGYCFLSVSISPFIILHLFLLVCL